eukprot:Gb_41443 [translate_table: standard]
MIIIVWFFFSEARLSCTEVMLIMYIAGTMLGVASSILYTF